MSQAWRSSGGAPQPLTADIEHLTGAGLSTHGQPWVSAGTVQGLHLCYPVAGEFPTPDLLKSYAHALDILDDSLRSLHTLVRAHRAGERLANHAVDEIDQQCTAAAIIASTLRKTLAEYSS